MAPDLTTRIVSEAPLMPTDQNHVSRSCPGTRIRWFTRFPALRVRGFGFNDWDPFDRSRPDPVDGRAETKRDHFVRLLFRCDRRCFDGARDGQMHDGMVDRREGGDRVGVARLAAKDALTIGQVLLVTSLLRARATYPALLTGLRTVAGAIVRFSGAFPYVTWKQYPLLDWSRPTPLTGATAFEKLYF